jgi:aryl-alcohol dehydrogenase-like predicted oxidoreductase
MAEVDKIVLGTVQFGLNYGINNKSNKPSDYQLHEILDSAAELGISKLDTSNAYGDAIQRIGKYHRNSGVKFRILNKIKDVPPGEVYDQAQRFLEILQVPYFDVYSFHSFTDYLNFPLIMEELNVLKSKGLLKKIGISVYNNNELQKTIIDKNIDVIQLPYNLLDNQNLRGVAIEQAKRANKEIHARSVFLQGLFFMNGDSIPEYLIKLKPYLQKIKLYCEKESISLLALALSYAVYNQKIDNVLIGVDTKDQLLKNIESINDLKDTFDYINEYIHVKETELLNPVNWK